MALFPETLKNALEDHDPPWLPEDLSAELKRQGMQVSSVAIEHWLTCDFEPRLRTARCVADIFGMLLDHLYPSESLRNALKA